LQTKSAVPLGGGLSVQEIDATKRFLAANDPRELPGGIKRRTQASEQQLNLLFDYLSHQRPRSGARVHLESGRAQLQASLGLYDWPLWLNFDARFTQADRGRGLPRIVGLSVGHLPLPKFLFAWAGEKLLARYASANQGLVLASEMVEHLSFEPQRASLIYRWENDSYARAIGLVVTPDDLLRLRRYGEALAGVAAKAAGRPITLPELLQTLFGVARQQATSEVEAKRELRALLRVLGIHAAGRNPARMFPQVRDWPQASPLQVTLNGRLDTALHFMVSAALAADADLPFSNAIGVYKEWADSHGGSGFSFNDLAADRAGTRLGLRAKSEALALIDDLSQPRGPGSFLPPVADLPEDMQEPEFQRRFGGIDAPPYLALLADIDRRLDGLALLRCQSAACGSATR
ncbi:MAG TPA: hypothetical protein VGE47_07485, partial [Burkholderiaceae bacterium]